MWLWVVRSAVGGPRIVGMRLRAIGWLIVVCVCVTARPLSVVAQRTADPVQQPIYVEDSPAAQDLAEDAKHLCEQGEYAQAAQQLQAIIDQYPHKLMPTGEASYTDAILWARRTLREDAQLLTAYRTLFTAEAKRQLDQAMPTASKPIDPAGLRAVLSSYALTEPGLEAGLTLAAFHLERAEARDASSVLDGLADHPDLPQQAGRYHLLCGAASVLLGDRTGYDLHLGELEASGDTARRDALERFSHRLHPPQSPVDPQHPPLNASALPSDLRRPLWEIDLLDAIGTNDNLPINLRNTLRQRAVLRVLPAVVGERIILNLGEDIVAYDRASGWRLWEIDDQRDEAENPAVVLPRALVLEPRGVCVSGDTVFGLLGWQLPSQTTQHPGQGRVSLVAVGLEDGKTAWRVTPGELDPFLENAAFDGTPVASGDRLYVLVKRLRVSGLFDVYLTAINASDGSLIWRRHLSSSSSQSNYNIGPTPRMTLHAGRMYVCDNRGAVLALDALTGTVHWVRFLPDAGTIDPRSQVVRTTGIQDLPEPIVTATGLLVPPVGAGKAYDLLDPETGELLRVMNEGAWQGVGACYPAGPDVFAIHDDAVSLFDGSTLEEVWRKPFDAGQEGVVRGRPAIGLDRSGDNATRRGVVVFTNGRRLYALQLNDGQALDDVPCDVSGNLALSRGQILVASATGLSAYTDWDVAEEQLLALAGQHPADPRPGMALARLALRCDQAPQVLQGIDLALASLSQSPAHLDGPDDRQVLVFGLIDELTLSRDTVGAPLRGELLDRMAGIATGPKQEATYQLTRGRYMAERDQPELAVEHFQAVLADPALASQLYTTDRQSRPAGLEARRQIKQLILDHGRVVYQAYDLLAQADLQQLIDSGERSAKAYVALADRYPLAQCVNRARQIAADRALQSGDTADAIRQLQTVYLDTADTNDRAQIVERIVEVYQSHDRPEMARHWLRRVNREYPDLRLPDPSGPVTASDLLSRLDEQARLTTQWLPRIGVPLSDPEWIDGQPVHALLNVTGADPLHDRALMTGGGEVWMLSMPGPNEIWRVPMPAEDAQVLAWDGRQVIWWSPGANTLGALDSRTGQSLWGPIDCGAILKRAGDSNPQQKLRNQAQQQFMQFLGGATGRRSLRTDAPPANQLIWAVDLSSIVVADQLGRVACIDRDTGQPRWAVRGQADRLTAIALGDGLVALAGLSWADTQAQHGIITLRDPLTGERLKTTLQSEQSPVWMAFADNGLLIYQLQGSLQASDVATGLTQWRREAVNLTLQGARHALGGRMLFAASRLGQSGVALVVNTDTGRVVNQLPIRATAGRPQLLDMTDARDTWQVATPEQAVALDPSGRQLWTDAICAPVGHLRQQHVSDRYVLIVSGTSPQSVPNLPELNGLNQQDQKVLRDMLDQATDRAQASGYTLFVLDRHTGVIQRQQPLEAINGDIQPDSGVLLDGALLLGVDGRTMLLHGPVPTD